ncbi:hypothetical protein BC749_102208 [Flavobacterium araucananum]|uniref:Curlin subunit CsgB n=1 Tax=Flavobacterium araucananum TaxID=946678 RepID=A0A227P7W4_9FLAO|nr:hypothetical protein [Flavobacterium araucananum]OXG05832.1 hypothetical protein B0A64_12195 [Flavobacterium araucananum]PWK00644.1 hypothetical protein BC749_102208 [Flavobacterium araucananum]
MKRFVSIIFLLLTGIMFSQSVIDENIRDYVLNKDETNNQNQTINQYMKSRNIVLVTQIGNYNQANLTIVSKNAYVTAQQTGNNNYMNVYKKAEEINQSYTQTGNNNYISDFALYSGGITSMAINQQGNNLSVISTGSNSISKDLIINQSGNSGTIYVFNH